jgi:hypothetical protein
MLGVSTLFIIMSFIYVKRLHEERAKTKRVDKVYNSYVLKKPTDWSSDTTISEEKKMYYESLID